MTWQEIEILFNRALRFSFSKKKFLFLFPVLLVCGLMIVLCRTLAIGAGEWVVMSLTFLPVFLSSGLLLAAGVVLNRMYFDEVSHSPVSLRKILAQSWELLIGVTYITFPLLFAYLLLWMLLGIFHLLSAIPGLGNVLGVMLSFGPFLLVLGSLLLGLFNLLVLFFATPSLALMQKSKIKLLTSIFQSFLNHILSNLTLFFIGLIPLLFAIGILSLAAFITGLHFAVATDSIAVAVQWFFIMVPFCALLCPPLLFFFNVAVEGYQLTKKNAPT